MNVINNIYKGLDNVAGREVTIITPPDYEYNWFLSVIRDIYSAFHLDKRLFYFAVALSADALGLFVLHYKYRVLDGEIYVSLYCDNGKKYMFNSSQFEFITPVSIYEYEMYLDIYNEFNDIASIYHIWELKKIDFEIEVFLVSGLLQIRILEMSADGLISKRCLA